MSTPEDRRPGAGRQQRQRRAPLFPLEAEDIAPRERRGPPSPLGDMVSDIDDAMPVRGAPNRPAPRQASPTRPLAPAPERRSEPAARPTSRESVPAPRPATTRERPMPRQQLRPALLDELLEQEVEPLRQARNGVRQADADLRQLERMAARPQQAYGNNWSAPASPPLAMNHWLVMVVVAAASLLIIATFGGAAGVSALSRWAPFLGPAAEEAASRTQLFATARPAGDYTLKGAPSLTPEQIDRILENYGSPATGTGEQWYNLGLQYGIDPAFAVAFFIHESSAGTASAWAGLKPDGSSTHNVGNIICAGYATCYGRFRDYGSWAEGINDWYRLIDVEYIQGRGTQTVADIIPIYAPSFENDVQAYVNSVNNLVDDWRTNGVE